MTKLSSSPKEFIIIHDTRTNIMDNVNYVIKILDIGLNSVFEKHYKQHK